MHKCNEARIRQFLQHELTGAEQQELEQHLEACETCCAQLNDSTADAMWWGMASAFLPDAADDLEPLSQELSTSIRLHDGSSVDEVSSERSGDSSENSQEDFHPTSSVDRSKLPASVQNVLQLLSATDDPQMLGRLGGYEIAGVVGAGGMGVVLKAFDRSLNRYVAIKVLAPHLATGGAARKRFAREAQAAAAVVHENVIAIHGVNEAMGLPYLVMPYVKGQSLQKRLHDEGSLEVTEVLRIASQTAAGLAAAHAQGLIHRDVKPGNILLADGVERVTITDFGLARAADDASLTCSGTIAGTPQYMSPEQARGDTVDQRTDLFSLGSVIYAMCTGRPPFRAESSYGVLRRITDARPRSIRDINPAIPDWLCRLVERLHAKLPSERYASAAEVAAELEQCLAHVQHPTREHLPAGLEARSGFGLNRKSVWVAASVLLLVVVGFGVFGDLLWDRNVSQDAANTQQQSDSPEDAATEAVERDLVERELVVAAQEQELPARGESTSVDDSVEAGESVASQVLQEWLWSDESELELLELERSIEALELDVEME